MFRYLQILIIATISPIVLSQNLTSYVNPFIGTTNFGATNPGAIVPQGMVSVVPFNVSGSGDNKYDKDARWWSTPYSWDNHYFTGYTHVNLSGVGCPELGVILVMPTTGEINANIKEYGSVYTDQLASPGYYSNFLSKYQIKTEVTTTKRAGISRFIFPKGRSNILINLGTGLTNETGAMVRIINSREIEGWRMTGGFCYNDGTERPVYFSAWFSKPPVEKGVWKKMPEMKAEADWSKTSGKIKYYKEYSQQMTGDSIGAWFSFDTREGEEVMIKVGVSYTSIENARRNLYAEIPDYNFDKVRENAEKDWNNVLSKVEVEGGTEDQKSIFYTAMYHMNIHPNVLNDVNGLYPGMEVDINGQTDNTRYTVFSLWDTYRNFHQFMSLVYPDKQLDMVNSMLDMYMESGWLPKWELNSKETHVMEGDPAIPVIVDTYLRGIKDFNTERAYHAMYKSATTIGSENKLRPDIDDYVEKGYIPLLEEFDNSVSHALEYYIADWNLAQFAKQLNKMDDYNIFLNQSLRYKEYFDSVEYQMIRPKLPDGSFLTPFDPKQGENFEPCPGFHEGTAWQYTFYVPHDIPGLMKLMGGEDKFVAKLQKVFDEDLFDMANEPDINYPYLFNYIKGEEWRTQKEVRNLVNTYYKNTPDGLPGNDDCGTLSAWIAFSMMGIYPVCPGDMNYAITSPVFDKIKISLNNKFYQGDHVIINVHRKKPEHIYISKIELNGTPFNSFFINHEVMVSGGVLDIYLTKNPTIK